MAVPVLSAAKRLCERSGWALSNLELQKILYLAHMYNLGVKGEPLVSGYFEAWDYGPVHPELYHAVKVFGSSPVKNIFHAVPDLPDSPETAMLDFAVDQLGTWSPARLVAATHWTNGAWAQHYLSGARGIVIPNQDIQQEYANRSNAAQDQ